MASRESRRALGRLYLVTDRAAMSAGRKSGLAEEADAAFDTEAGAIVATVAAAVAGVPRGAAVVQVRDKASDARQLLALTRRVIAVCRPRGCPVLVNERLDVAVAAGADGVHLPESGMSVADARALGGPGFLIGCSTHAARDAVARAIDGADLVVLGPIWATPSKARYGPPLGPDALAIAAAEIARCAPHAALFAIGGVTEPARAAAAVARGARGIAAIRAICGAEPGVAAASLHRAADEAADEAADAASHATGRAARTGPDEAV